MSNMEEMLKKFSSNTNELLKFLEKLDDVDIEKLSKKDKEILLEQLESIENITGKAESLSLKTKREGVPEIGKNPVAPKEELKIQKRHNLAKPTFNPNSSLTNPTKEKDKE
jgi:hypothetical protein